jgi:hypothetical protein
VIGVVKLVQSNASSDGHFGPLPPGMSPGYPPGFPPNAPQNVPPGGSPGFQGFPPASPQDVAPSAPQNPEQPPSSGEVKNV